MMTLMMTLMVTLMVTLSEPERVTGSESVREGGWFVGGGDRALLDGYCYHKVLGGTLLAKC